MPDLMGRYSGSARRAVGSAYPRWCDLAVRQRFEQQVRKPPVPNVVLTAFVIGLVLVPHHAARRSSGPARPLLAMTGSWAVGAALTAWVSLGFTDPGAREFMRDFWSDGLAPWSEGPLAVASWIAGRLYHVLAHFLVFMDQEFGILAAPLALLAVLGLPPLWQRYRERGLILLAPVLGALCGGLAASSP